MRMLRLCLALLAFKAAAAPPSNDDCTGAQTIPGNGPFPFLTTSVNVAEATSAGDPGAPLCQSSVSRSVWYQFTPSTSGDYVLTTCADASGSTLPDTVIALYTSSLGCAGPFAQPAGACDDDSCTLKPYQSRLVTTLTGGVTYYVLVYSYSSTPPAPTASTVQLRVSRAGAPGNDTCASPASLTLDVPSRGSNLAAANDYQLTSVACFADGGQVATDAPGGDVVYSFNAPSSGHYSFRARNALADLTLYLSPTCPTGSPPVTVAACTDATNRGFVQGEELSCVNLSAGSTTYAFVDGTYSTDLGGNFELEVNACFPEVEPNDSAAQAIGLSCPTTGSIDPLGDVDFYALGNLTGRVFALVDGQSSWSSDFDLRVTNGTDTLEYDDGDADWPFGVSSAAVAGTEINGPSYLRVSYYGNYAAVWPYRLYAVVQPPASQAIAETEPNDTAAQPNTDPSLYFSGTLSPQLDLPSADVDFYSVAATQGDLIFVALDGDPLRDDSPLDAMLTVLDASGNVVALVDDSNAYEVLTDAGVGDLNAIGPSSPAEALTFRAPQTGTYFIKVNAGDHAPQDRWAGDYLLSISKNCKRPAPYLASVTPNRGPAAGATSVTLAGAHFSQGAQVRFGNAVANSVNVTSPTRLTCQTPVGSAGFVDVTVTNPDLQGSTLDAGFQYLAPPPLITAVSPDAGPALGGVRVVVTGSGFQQGATVNFGGLDGTAAVLGGATVITVTTPAHAPATVAVTVTNPDGQAVTKANAYTFQMAPPPALVSVSPKTGPVLTRSLVTLRGNDFLEGASVTFGATPSSQVTFVNATRLDVLTPEEGPQLVDLVVRNPDGQTATLPLAFTFLDEVVGTGGGSGGASDSGAVDAGSGPAKKGGCGCQSSTTLLLTLGALAWLSRTLKWNRAR